jgi:hypothetical protein
MSGVDRQRLLSMELRIEISTSQHMADAYLAQRGRRISLYWGRTCTGGLASSQFSID